MKARHPLFAAALLALGIAAAPGLAHNNPKFKEVFLRSVPLAAQPVDAATGSFTAPFEVVLPDRSAELVWHVKSAHPDRVTFSVAVDGKVVAEGVGDGQTSPLTHRGTLKVTIVQVAGVEPDTSLDLYANVIDRSTS
jgi:hypothetical protein